ncbi:MAG: hypothetical protein A2725_02600 [Candidatus Magasanikbacteria bacterium RIFCSPHIGHO2_01_FULL_33_34]|uniref:SMP-30/Gluconolactonase/LRE-like region domain-containing protein n=1 Tax=Candidatus Magasanikbacteria bacterium RIFCSPHIGHO2_01_FULL_33_34 TaxID=1798671 RepID=A0A1F6LKE7_9BACT|nr:MAG: hypothetical protein A2725_02600 [Candidatus Magasanikbacteria bacterium RIFCSPHIGHO2_01_FULL_33_34]OGH65591.1 MAG: hypothetical protein A3B83_01800 [Candidatus Magasanikbacteria bacterium RIFCSPHIGHO2_02_FULL_33_17]OGH75800.1 MAG: hypothetical protein A3A89_02695 [Candidatus Magasanikbacteria bacterium RIFCSPLOWO2_01_FULL_33_34]OGH81344.1 MAG: hypothetical protein A3F93_02155 [Candidatus Magasanikbacteria bacterium RIFCSPLOWO2_12_FULL_34_7]
MKKAIILISILIAIFLAVFLLFFANKNTRSSFIIDAYELPSVLHEVSSISYIGDDKIACIQDELGTIFIYDLKARKIINEIDFALPGDYEGIEYVNEKFYILRSDGVLYEIQNSKINPQVAEYNLDLFAKNNEGLTYDREGNRLLISTKSKVAPGKEAKNERHIYAFDLTKKEIGKTPVITMNLDDVETYINNNEVDLESKNDKAKKILKFRPSGIAMHPINKRLYIVSAIDNLVISTDLKGTILTIHQLDISIFNKPEGIDFYENGDALISNEGGNGNPTLLKLKIENLN